MKWRSSTSALLVLALVLSVASARAQGTPAPAPVKAAPGCPSFEECYRLAIRLYKAEQVPEALAAFEAAYSFTPEPNLLINIGRAHFRLGHYREALDYYQRFQSKSPGADESVRTRVEQYIAEAKKALDSAAPSPAPGAVSPSVSSVSPSVSSVSPSVSSVSPSVSPAAAPGPSEPGTGTTAKKGTEGAAATDSGTPAAGRAAVAAAPSAEAPTDSAARAESRPLYKKWWFWGVLGLVVAGGVTAGVVLGTQQTAADLSGIEVRKLRF